MAIDYVLNWTDDALKEPFKLSAQSTNITATSLMLSGKGSANWAEAVQQNMIRLLENFCSNDRPPPQPTAGQLWFNSAQNILKCYWNGRWNDVGYHRIDHTHPPPQPNFLGDLWYDLTNDCLKVYNGTYWDKAYQGGLPEAPTIPIPAPAVPTPVTPSPGGPISPTPLPPGVPTPTPTVPTVPTPVVPTAPTPTPSVTPVPTVSPTPVAPPTPVPVAPAPTPTPTVVPVPTPVSPPAPVPTGTNVQPYGIVGNWELTFRDEFDTTTLNTNFWRDVSFTGGDTQTRNYSVSGGMLRIWPTQDALPRRINTDTKLTFLHGFFEIEAKMPHGKGLRALFYLMSRDDGTRPEISFMDVLTSAPLDRVLSTPDHRPISYYAQMWKANASYSLVQNVYAKNMRSVFPLEDVVLSESFHKYGCYWDPTGVIFYFDGKPIGKWDDDGTGYFHRRMFLMMSLQYGSLSGMPDETTPMGSGNSLEINYVRVWKAQPPPVSPVPTTTPWGRPGPVGQDGSKYEMTFQDEFDSSSTNINSTYWNPSIWYEMSNVTTNYAVHGGKLKIWPQRSGSGNNFFNRTIDTDKKMYFLHGYLEVRAKLPQGQGLQPAIWLYNREVDNSYVVRPEIDLLTAYTSGGIDNGWSDSQKNPTAYQVTIYTGPNYTNIAGDKQIANNGLLNNVFNNYGLKWEPNRITFYFNGREVYSVAVTMDKRMYLLISLWMGSAGQVGGAPDSTTPTGMQNSFEIEYVRHWRFI